MSHHVAKCMHDANVEWHKPEPVILIIRRSIDCIVLVWFATLEETAIVEQLSMVLR